MQQHRDAVTAGRARRDELPDGGEEITPSWSSTRSATSRSTPAPPTCSFTWRRPATRSQPPSSPRTGPSAAGATFSPTRSSPPPSSTATSTTPTSSPRRPRRLRLTAPQPPARPPLGPSARLAQGMLVGAVPCFGAAAEDLPGHPSRSQGAHRVFRGIVATRKVKAADGMGIGWWLAGLTAGPPAGDGGLRPLQGRRRRTNGSWAMSHRAIDPDGPAFLGMPVILHVAVGVAPWRVPDSSRTT
jgi:hypothetical protein